jgi:hypothetical protein
MKAMRLCAALVCCLSLSAFATNAPTNFTATGDTSSTVILSWTDNATDETGFTFAFDTNAALSNPTYIWAGGANTTSYTHTGRSAATTYYYKIKAEGNPDSSWTAVDAATTRPTSLSATVVSSSQINLSWTGNSANSATSGYTVATATNSAFTGAIYTYVNGAGTTTLNKTGLYAGTTYYFKVKVEGSSDAYDSPFSTVVNTTTSSAAPNAPSNLSASAVSSSQIDLSWTDNSTNETGFELKRATDSGFTQNVVWIGGIQGTSYSNTGLSPSTTYYYKVRAQGASQNSAYSNTVNATTSASGATIPTAPSGLSATVLSNTSIRLQWTDNSSNETGFELKRATDSGFTANVVWIGGIQGTTYTNTGLTAGTTYYYKVRAEGTAGKSAYSSYVSATTTSSAGSGTPISSHFFGINAWMPDQIGDHKYWGKLEQKWQEIQDSSVKIMRYGGHGVDVHADPTWVDPTDPSKSTYAQYLALVDEMQARGIEPVLQVPVDGGNFTASQAADLVDYINNTMGRNVKYWSIGNEPNLTGSSYQPTSASSIAAYIKPFASAMKAVSPGILILGPDIAGYDDTIMNALTTCDGLGSDITGTDGAGRYYVDVVTFHYYNGDDTQVRDDVTTDLTDSGGFNDHVASLKSRLTSCHGRTIPIAITEANVTWENKSTDGLTGIGAKSFVGGQWWAEMAGLSMLQGVDFVNYWSVIEGNSTALDIGYLSRDNVTKHPSYYHFQMLSQNFRGGAITTTDNQANVKVFASQDTDQIAVIILNQHETASYDYKVRLNNDTLTTNTLKINVNAGVAAETTGTIADETTILLVFDTSGVLKKKIEYNVSGAAPVTTTY